MGLVDLTRKVTFTQNNGFGVLTKAGKLEMGVESCSMRPDSGLQKL